MFNLIVGIGLFLLVVAGVLTGINDIRDKSCNVGNIQNKDQLEFCTGLTYSEKDTQKLVSWYRHTGK